MWRNNGTKIDNNIYSDGKWRFLTFDLDFSIIYDYEQYITEEEGFKYNKFESLLVLKVLAVILLQVYFWHF